MRITLIRQNEEEEYSETDYYIDETKVLDWIQGNILKGLGKKFKLPKGPTIDLSRKSLPSVALRQLCSMIICPILYWISDQNSIELPYREDHTNVIEWAVRSYFLISAHILNDMHLTSKDEPYIDGMRIIQDVKVDKDSNSIKSMMLLPNNVTGYKDEQTN